MSSWTHGHLVLLAAYAPREFPPSCDMAPVRPPAVVALAAPTELARSRDQIVPVAQARTRFVPRPPGLERAPRSDSDGVVVSRSDEF